MNITRDQANDLLDGPTPGPWENLHVEWVDKDGVERETWFICDESDVLIRTCKQEDAEANANLAAAAPDLAQTIAGMRWEYAVEMMEEEWEMVGLYGPDEPWGSEADARGAMKAWRSPRPIRLVRRLVGPVEVAE